MPGRDVQDCSDLSPTGNGPNDSAFLRIGRGRIEMASAVIEPDVAVLMNEATADEQDFAEGTSDALYVLNTQRGPEETARKHLLAGTVVTIDGEALGNRFLGRPLANVAVLAALVRASGLVDVATARASL